MSILETPRIHFRGQISWDPIVTNNYPQFYDENTAESTLPRAATVRQQVEAFRETAIGAVATKGNWNPHGTHRSTFFDTEVTGVDTGSGVDTSDSFVGAPIGFSGMLVDCEPYGAFTSQLFFDTMEFGIAGGCRVSAKRTSRMTARYINFVRNPHNSMIAGIASVVWQTSFTLDGMNIDPHGSPALLALDGAMADDDVQGLTVRWTSYRTIYYGDSSLRNGTPQSKAAAQIHTQRLHTGGFQPNPARSLIVGTLGVWRRGEPAHEPGDRALLSAQPSGMVATAHARVHGDNLTIDLSNSIAEVDLNLSKQDLGSLDVVAVAADDLTVVAQLGRLTYHQYDRTAYELGAGLVTLVLDPGQQAAATGNNIQVRGSGGIVYLAENPYRAIPGEPNCYLDEGDPASTATVCLYVRGEPAPAGVNATMYDATGAAPVEIASTTTDTAGIATFPLWANVGGEVRALIFVGGPDAVAPEQLDTQRTTYMHVRTLPEDASVAALPPTWDNVYTHVLANWNAMAPCMDNWLRLDDPVQVKAYGAVLRRLTDPANFESFRFMPVTRDMTAGERTLLWNFLDAPSEEQADHGVAAASDDPAPARARRDLAKLSRSLRSG